MIRADEQHADPVRAGWSAWAGPVAAGAGAFVLAGRFPAWVVAVYVLVVGVVVVAVGRRRAARWRAGLAGVIDGVVGADKESVEAGAAGVDRVAALVASALARAERRAGEAAASAERCRAVLDAVGVPVIATDDSGRVSLVNAEARRLLGEGREVVGVAFEELITGSALLELRARAERGEACRGRVRLTLTETARIYEVSAVPEGDTGAGGGGVVLTIRDVHELSQTARLRTDFAANASHELRTPIAALRAAVDTLGGAAAEDAAMRARLVGMMDSNTARLEEIVDDLLDLSRLESEDRPLRVETVDTGELAEALAGMFEAVCRARDLSIEFDLRRPGRLRTDRNLLLLVLRNLIDNATKFAFEGTTVRVRSEPAGGDGVRFVVADRGIGIPLKHQTRIFERFYQVDESRARIGARRGSGLGLAIVRHALRRLGGEIRVESVWQEGTTMTVEIPGCAEQRADGPRTP